MMKKEAREAKGAFWLEHLRECTAAGGCLAEYARSHELDAEEGYRWKRILRHAGQWPIAEKRKGRAASSRVAGQSVARFARVRIEAQRAEPFAPLRLQVLLSNGRRAELLLSDEQQLSRVLTLLEQPG